MAPLPNTAYLFHPVPCHVVSGQSADTEGSQLCPSCLGVTVIQFCKRCLETADRRRQQVLGHPHTDTAAHLNAERNEITVIITCTSYWVFYHIAFKIQQIT